MTKIPLGFRLLFLLMAICVTSLRAQSVIEGERFEFDVSGYLRTGTGRSEGGDPQAHFQMPGALNKYSLGNQADTYGELEFDYTHYLDSAKTKSIDAVWMLSIYQDFGKGSTMNLNPTEQLYLRANNLFGHGESIWVGNRFYDRRAIHLLDRQWINPAQKGWGAGVEHLIKPQSDEDIKFGLWQFKDADVVSFLDDERMGNLYNYTLDARWVNIPLDERLKISFAANYSLRTKNEELGYKTRHGFGLFSWLDYAQNWVTNTTALLFRQGANVSVDHWSGVSYRENPLGDNWVTSDLSKGYSLELNNNFLYDDLDRFALNGILMAVVRDYGTTPYQLVDGKPQYAADKGRMMYWLSAGARSMYYVSNHFRPSLEYTYEYIDNRQLGVAGHLNKVTFSPELSLSKGFYSRPVLRPFVTYAFWSDSLRGYVGNTPNGAPYGNKTAGFTYGLQFEVWW